MSTTINQVGRSDTGSRAREPDEQGVVERCGVRTQWERFGDGDPAILLLPTWSIVHSRFWKAQVHYLARHATVVTFDGRGNGLSDRPLEPSAYDAVEYADDAVAVLDATGIERACVAGLSLGGLYAAHFAVRHPDRCEGAALIAPAIPLLIPPDPARSAYSFEDELETSEGWARYNRHAWMRDYRGFLGFFFARMFSEPHSTKQIEDCVAWGLDTTSEVLIATKGARAGYDSRAQVEALLQSIRCPVVVLQGSADEISQPGRGARVAELTGGELMLLEGSGHGPQGRDPVQVNLALRALLERVHPHPPATRSWSRARVRPKRALLVSSPIGLGHAWRDIAIAHELRRQVPGLEIEWLAQPPVTRVLEQCGERIHPASVELASESDHIESESSAHALHCFEAIRRMDEILIANFMVFHDVVSTESYDLWIADEAWDVDHFLHENPELKTAAYCWLTDFVGWLPTPDGGPREAFLTAEYNAEMLEQIARAPRVRDRSIFVGSPDDIVPGRFGTDLPVIRDWTERHYAFAGYVTGFGRDAVADREALRAQLGYGPDERVCIVSVGGSGVGRALLERAGASFGHAMRLVPGLRMILVTGPRIDPASLSAQDGLELRPYVHDLDRHLAACDLAIVQGGLTTAMELTANQRPFLYFPLRGHFEQTYHVRHRLERYGAGRYLDFEATPPDVLATAIAAEIGRVVDYRPVETDGAARAAALIAELL